MKLKGIEFVYTFKKTEINNKKASEFETKSMLYLLGMRVDSDEIDLITVDCFNDVTGANEEFSKLWDVQSKNHGTLPPSKIGESLVTLYENFISSIDFCDYILFIPELNREYLIDCKVSTYNYKNIENKQRLGIEKKLKEKINGDKSGTTPPLFADFLIKVTFVEDTKNISEYIKKLTRFRNKRFIPQEIYEGIFNEIRDVQSALKNSYIENEKINHPSEVLKFKRHITKLQINTLLISRLVGVDIFSFQGVPASFVPFVKNLESEELKDLLQDCNGNLSRAFFDKNGCKEFWRVSEKIISMMNANPSDSVQKIYDGLVLTIKIKTLYLTESTILFMISLIKTGLENDC